MSKKYLDSAGLNKFAAMVLSKFAAKNHSHSNATTNSAGFMSSSDKVKLDGVAAGANRTIVDSTLSSTSVNAIQNKAVKTALDGKASSSHIHPTAQITGLDSALAGKAPSSHSHSADNITSGVLPIGRGGTGSTNSVGAASTMLNALSSGTAAPRDDDWYVAKYAEDGNDTPIRRTHSALWSYIKSKCDGLYQPRGSYASSSHTHTIANVSNLQSTLDSKASVSHTHSNATATTSGFMSNTDKSKLDGVSAGANQTIVDASFSATSTNPVQNKVVKAALDAKASSSHTHTTSQVSGLDAALASKAPSSHNHSADNITSGVLPIGRGGTGATSANGIRGAIGINPVTTSGTGAAYTASVGGLTTMAKGITFVMVPHTVSTTTAPTLNVNGMGAKTIRRLVSGTLNNTVAPVNNDFLKAGIPTRVIYNGEFWIVESTRPQASDLYGTIGSSQIANDSISLSKLASDVGTVYVGSSQPSDSNVKIWIQT